MVPGEADILFAGIGHVDDSSNPYREPKCQHLTCFVGGLLSLGGRLVNNETHVELGHKVAEGCVWAYRKSPLGIMPKFLERNERVFGADHLGLGFERRVCWGRG